MTKAQGHETTRNIKARYNHVAKAPVKSPDNNAKARKVYSITDYGRHCLANWTVALGQYSVDIIGLVSEIEDVLERKSK